MKEFWSTSGLDLFVETRWTRRRTSLEDGLRRAIQAGRLVYGARLPSTRALAHDLGISRGTVAAAYDQLIAEGYLAARRGSGTTVALHASGAERSAAGWTAMWRYDLRPGRPPVGSFPVADWIRHQRDALRAASPASFGYGDPAGALELRTALASYLGRTRGVQTSAANIIITAGITQALSLLGRLVAETGRPVATEDPGFGFHREVLAHAGARVVPLPVDRNGAVPAALAATGAGTAVVTPAHQYPTGVTMTAARRTRLVAWAHAENALIVEDDYDGELRYDRRAVGALQPSAPDRVIYVGTASKTLGPALRLGWLIVPDALVDAVTQEQMMTVRALEITSQLGLAHYLHHHAYDQRVRAVRAGYHSRFRRLADLVTVLAKEIPGLRLGGVSAGGQAPLYLPHDGPTEDALVRSAAAEQIGVEGMAVSSHVPGTHPPGLLLGFARPPDHLFQATLEALARVLRSMH